MKLWTIDELMHMTRDELCNLADNIGSALPDFEPGTVGRLNALTSLANIRRVLMLRCFRF